MFSTARTAVTRGAAVIGLAAAALLTVAPAAGAAPVPSPDCAIPSLSAIPTNVSPGTSITVTGKNFAGCAAQGDASAPAVVNQVKVGIATDQKVTTVLAQTDTAVDPLGSFTVTITIPDVPSASDKIALAAAAEDSKTGLTYFAVLPLQYSGGSATPTAVPAGTGGLGLSDDSGNTTLTVAGGVGLALAGAGALGLRRRKVSAHS